MDNERAEKYLQFLRWRLVHRTPEELQRISAGIECASRAHVHLNGRIKPGDELQRERAANERLEREFDEWLKRERAG